MFSKKEYGFTAMTGKHHNCVKLTIVTYQGGAYYNGPIIAHIMCFFKYNITEVNWIRYGLSTLAIVYTIIFLVKH